MSERSPRGNLRAARLRVKFPREFNSTLYLSSHGFATETKALPREIPPATQAIRVPKGTGVCVSTFSDWLKKSTPLPRPIRSNSSNTNRASLPRIPVLGVLTVCVRLLSLILRHTSENRSLEPGLFKGWISLSTG